MSKTTTIPLVDTQNMSADTIVSPDYNMQELIHTVLQCFFDPMGKATVIETVLALVGDYFNVSRVYIFEDSEKGLYTSNTYEWVNAGIKPMRENLQNVDLKALDAYYVFFDERNIFCVHDIETMNEKIRDVLRLQGVRAVLQTRLIYEGRPFGMIGFDECLRTRQWTGEEKIALDTVACLVAMFLVKERACGKSSRNQRIALDLMGKLDSWLYVVDVENFHIRFFNDKLRMLDSHVQLGKPCYTQLLGNAEAPCSFCPILTYKKDNTQTSTNYELNNPQYKMSFAISSFIFDWFDGRKVCFLSCLDITEKKKFEARLEEFAYQDAVTGIANNHKLDLEGPLLFKKALKNAQHVACIAFKFRSLQKITLYTGYDKGDQLLKKSIRAMRDALPKEAFLARIRSNNFCILYPYTSSGDLQADKAMLKHLLRICAEAIVALRMPELYLNWFSFTAGISLTPFSANQFEVASRMAFRALSFAGDPPFKSIVFYDAPSIQAHVRYDSLTTEMDKAYKQGEFALYYQPKCTVDDRTVIGTEALIRWNHPLHGLLTAGVFMALAEENNFSVKLDMWVMKEVCRNLRELFDQGCVPVRTSINLSPSLFYQDTVVDMLGNAMEQYAIPADLLEVEITERIALEDLDTAVEVMNKIRAMGVSISIDDFGTGYSSLNYLQKLPFDVIKLDRSFLDTIETSTPSRDIVHCIVNLARILSASVVFEGIETEEQFAFAKAVHCDAVQGFYTGRPMPLTALATLLERAR